MLVLSRKTGETIFVDNDIAVTVLEARRNRVKIGIVAPDDVCVLREEVYMRTVGKGLQTSSYASDEADVVSIDKKRSSSG